MPKIINLASMSGPEASHAPGEEIEVDEETAKERVAAGLAAWPEGSAEAKAAAKEQAAAAKAEAEAQAAAVAATEAAPPAATPDTEAAPEDTEAAPEDTETAAPAEPAPKVTRQREGGTVETTSVEPPTRKR